MENAFFKLTDHRNDRMSVHVRLSEVESVSDPQSDRHDWVVAVRMRNGVAYTMSGDINTIYRKRDELMHALEQDAKPQDITADELQTLKDLREGRAGVVPKQQDRRTVYGHGDD